MIPFQKLLDDLTSKTKALGWHGPPPDLAKETEDAHHEADRILLGKLFTTKPLNQTGVREAIFKAWSFIKDLEMEIGMNDTLIFSFPNASIRNTVLAQCPI